jgi:1-acyl-sn-glycerol-3-phosphate acyltransferase
MKKILIYSYGTLFLLYFFLTLALFVVLLALVRLLTCFFDPHRVLMHYMLAAYAGMCLWVNILWRYKVKGRKKIVNKKKYVIVSNHQSVLDIFLIFQIYKTFRWVSKIENFQIPLVGWTLLLANYIKLERGKSSSTARMMLDCEKTLARGCPVIIFPEGTRSETGQMRNFKEGAFTIALKTKTDILPIVLDGSVKALPKNGFFLKNTANLRVQVLDAIPYESFAQLSPQELAVKVRTLIDTELQAMRNNIKK